jgi:HK97 family phage major capsid protein
MYGMPVVVSPEMPAKADGAAGAVIVATSNFVMPRIRGLRVQSDYYVEKQQQVIVATQRFGFSDIIAGQAVVAMTYDYS